MSLGGKSPMRSLSQPDECVGLISPVEMSLENTTGIIRVERLAVGANRSDPAR